MKLTVQQRPEDSGLIAPWSAVFDAPGGTLGRSTDNHLTLPDPDGGICRVQAALRISDDTCYLVNLSSMSHVSINGRAILRDQEVPLVPGDELVIGSYTLKAEDPSTVTVDNTAPTALAGAFVAAHDPLLAEPDPLLESPLLDMTSPQIQPVAPVGTVKAAVEATSPDVKPTSVQAQPVAAPAEPSAPIESVAAAQPTAMVEPTPAIQPATSAKPALSAESEAPVEPATSTPPIVSTQPATSTPPTASAHPGTQASPADLGTTPAAHNVADTAAPPTEPTTFAPPATSPITPTPPVTTATPVPPEAPAASAPPAPPTAQEFAAPPPSGSPFDEAPPDEALLPDLSPADTSTTDVFSDLFGGPGTVPVGSAPDVSAHPFDMESAQNRNPEDPLRHVPRGDANVSGPLRDPLDALSSHDDNDGHNVFSDQTPSTLPSDDPLAPHRLDPLGETLNSTREHDNNGWAARDNLREYGGFLRPARVQQPAPKKDTPEEEPSPPRRK